MPQSIPSVLIRDHVLKALADLKAGASHPFGSPTGYELVFEGQRFAPKAVIGIAHQHAKGRMLQPDEFSGGESPGQANFVLRRLGFDVVKKGEEAEVETDAETTSKNWTEDEVSVVVADYFEMLKLDLNGSSYNKTERRRAILPMLNARSNGSVEFKHANISAVLLELGMPYIDGYKPRGNYQALLMQTVEDHLERNPTLSETLQAAPVINPAAKAQSPTIDLEQVIEAPPVQIIQPRRSGKSWVTRRGRRIDFAEVDARNRFLAKQGEEFVVQVEKHRLLQLGRDDLARRVDWVAQTIGDGLGFDVLSFDDTTDAERFLEVKTTGLGKFFPFYVTINEVDCSEDVPDKYHLYRVFDFAKDPRLYILHGSLRQRCVLEPTQFRASPV